MFQQLKNIDTAFRHIRLFSFIIIVACVVITGYTVFESYRMVTSAQQTIYLLTGGQALAARASDRKDNMEVEARDHIRMFHYYFFTLDPDDKVIESNIRQALYLADNTASRQYQDLKENGYYSSIISGNVSQQLTTDSIRIDLSSYPYYFKYSGTERIIRPTAIVTRNLSTDGYLRSVSRSDNNAHGFLIERWRILDNSDKDIQKR